MTAVQTLLPDAETPGETAYDVGFQHGDSGHEFFNDRIPRKDRRDYARGYTRGALARARRNQQEVPDGC